MTDADITVTGAREHNLRDVSLRIPKNRITVFTGVSGSGKSSIVFDTVAVEAQRQLGDTFSAYVRSHLPRYQRPDVDAVENLTAPVVVDQKPVGGNARSTVGTMTDIYSLVRVLYSRLGVPHRPAGAYSFNSPDGMCPECDGLGQARRVDVEEMLDTSRSLDDGAIRLPTHKVGGIDWQLYALSGHFDNGKRLADYTADEWHMLLHGSGDKVTVTAKNSSSTLRYEGVVARFARTNLKRDLSALGERGRSNIERFITVGECDACGGSRLRPEALVPTVGGYDIARFCRTEIAELAGRLTALPADDPAAATVVASVRRALQRIDDIGLGYLTLDRATSSLSGGEAQRLKLVRHLGSSLVGMTYVFDEPSTGLHPRDVGRLTDLLAELRDRGNTVIVVEHDPDVMAVADHVVDVGPGAGADGGRVVFAGPFPELAGAATPTGEALRRVTGTRETPREPTGRLAVSGARLHNLKDVTVEVPTGVLSVLTGVAGSGKSSLVAELVRAHPDILLVDQSPIAASARSTPASFLDVMDPIRAAFARASGAPASLFSFNSAGACAGCGGRGELLVELAYADPVRTDCDACGGRRFDADVLTHRLRGLSIADVLDLSATDAVDFFGAADGAGVGPVAGPLGRLVDVGLDHLGIGRALSTLSGGERQRLKLASHLGRRGSVLVLDEPTTGLHLSDVDALVDLFDRIVDGGGTVLVVEHNLDVVRRADHVIDLGPDGGSGGGRVVFAGPVADLLTDTRSSTAEYLRRYLRHGVAAMA